MTNGSVPPPPTESPLGWPLVQRRHEFRRLAEEPVKETDRIENFQGQTVVLPIRRVPLNLPKYRISNGRTASAQQEHIANKNLSLDFFDRCDPELENVQAAQHQILIGMVREEGLFDKFKDATNKQVDTIILDENGFVVNGNRRLCCWRLLYASDADAYGHFSHVDVVILPHCDEKELDRLEARLQIEKDIRSDYTWDAEANMMFQKQKLHGFTTAELAQLYGKSSKEIEDILAMRELAAEYLKSRKKENAWSEVKDGKFAFQELLKARNATSSAGDKEIIKQAAFALIDDPSKAGERLYAVIPKVREHIDPVKESLFDAFPLEAPEQDQVAEDAFGTTRATTSEPPKRSEMALVAEMKKDEAAVAKARDVVIETIRSQEEQAKERNAADFLLKTIKKANALIQNAAGHGLKPESASAGVAAQLESLRDGIARIEAWLKERA